MLQILARVAETVRVSVIRWALVARGYLVYEVPNGRGFLALALYRGVACVAQGVGDSRRAALEDLRKQVLGRH